MIRNPFELLTSKRPRPGDLDEQVAWLRSAAEAFRQFDAPAAHNVADRLDDAVQNIHAHMARGRPLDPVKFNERFASLVDQVQGLLVRFLYSLVSDCERRLKQRVAGLQPGTREFERARLAKEAYATLRQGVEHFVTYCTKRDLEARQQAVRMLRSAQRSLGQLSARAA